MIVRKPRISARLLWVVLLAFPYVSCAVEGEPLVVAKGTLDLSGHLERVAADPAVTYPVYGTWEVYVGEALTPQQVAEREPRSFQRVPPRQGRYYNARGERLVSGSITYRLQLHNVPQGVPAGLRVPMVHGTLQAYVNGVAAATVGEPPAGISTRTDARAGSGPVARFAGRARVQGGVIVPIIPNDRGYADLVLVIESTHYPFGGLTFLPPQLGMLNCLTRDRTARAFRDGLLIGIALLIAAYHLLLLLSPNRDIPTGHMAVLALLVAFRLAVVEGEMVLAGLTGLPGDLFLRLRGIAAYLLLPVFTRLLQRLWPLESYGRTFRVVQWVSMLWLVASLVVPLRWWMDLLFGYYVLVAVAVAAIFATVVRAMQSRRGASRFIFGGLVCLTLAFGVDFLRLAGLLRINFFVGIYGTTLFLIINSFAVSRKLIDFRLSLSNLREQAQRDGLTGLFNRRTFDSRLQEEWTRHVRSAQPLAVLMVDVDFFKPYNDTLGHQAGDQVLRRLARILEEHAQRTGDVAARYGGEEFVVILPHTDAHGAYQLAGSICAAVRATGMSHPGSPLHHITVSIGVAATVPEQDSRVARDARCLVGAADIALYDAKHHGRDTVRTAATEALRGCLDAEPGATPPASR